MLQNEMSVYLLFSVRMQCDQKNMLKVCETVFFLIIKLQCVMMRDAGFPQNAVSGWYDSRTFAADGLLLFFTPQHD